MSCFWRIGSFSGADRAQEKQFLPIGSFASIYRVIGWYSFHRGYETVLCSACSIFQPNQWPVERQTVLTQIILSLQCLQKIFLKCSSRRQNCDLRVFSPRGFVYFQNVMLFSEKCADPDEKSYHACDNSSRPSLFAKVPLLGENTKGKQNYLVACCRLQKWS